MRQYEMRQVQVMELVFRARPKAMLWSRSQPPSTQSVADSRTPSATPAAKKAPPAKPAAKKAARRR